MFKTTVLLPKTAPREAMVRSSNPLDVMAHITHHPGLGGLREGRSPNRFAQQPVLRKRRLMASFHPDRWFESTMAANLVTTTRILLNCAIAMAHHGTSGDISVF